MEETLRPHAIFADGGVIGYNPSRVGGSWCYLWVTRNGRRLRSNHGIVTPADIGLPVVTNNVTELLAVLMALRSVPDDWDGTIWTDSMVTLWRFTNSKKFNGIPNELRLEVLERRRKGRFRVLHLKGHPTPEDLDRGLTQDGQIVSVHNVFCDQKCQRIGQEFLAGQTAPHSCSPAVSSHPARSGRVG